MQHPVLFLRLWPLSQDARDIVTLESWAYHRTLIGEHPEPCLMCHNQLSEDEIILSNSHFLGHLGTPNFKLLSRTNSLFSYLQKFFTRK